MESRQLIWWAIEKKEIYNKLYCCKDMYNNIVTNVELLRVLRIIFLYCMVALRIIFKSLFVYLR